MGDSPTGPGSRAPPRAPEYRVLALAGFDPCRGDRRSVLNMFHTFARQHVSRPLPPHPFWVNSRLAALLLP